MGTAQAIIKKFMSYLDATSLSGRFAMDEATRGCSAFTSWQSVINSMIATQRSYRGDSDGFLMNECGINLYNEDTGAITGYDAGNGVVKTAESVVPENGSSVSPTSSSTTIKGLKVNWPTGSSLTQSQKNIIAGLNTWWIPGALELIEESYGLSFENGASVSEIDVNFVEDDSSALAYVSYEMSYSTGAYTAKNLSLNINMTYYNDISADDQNGVSDDTTFYLDRTIAHEMTHAVMAATINNFNRLPSLYFVEGIAELTHGIDDQRTTNIEILAEKSMDLQYALQDNTNASTSSYAGGYMLLRYFAKQAALLMPEGAYVSFSGNTMTLNNSFYTSVWLDGTNIFSGEEVYGNSSVININAKKTTNDTALAGNSQDNKIEAGSGNTNLWGGWLGNDTLVGGSGNDTFWYTKDGGNDVIDNISSNDTVNLFDFALSDISGIDYGDGNLLLNFNDGGTLNIVGGKTAGNVFNLGKDHTSWLFDGNSGNWTLV